MRLSPEAERTIEGPVAEAQRGDVAAFEELYRLHCGRVYTLCLRLAAEATLAEELTQDVFVRLWEKLTTFRGESAFATWLHRLAVNVSLDHLRAQRRRRERIDPQGDLRSLEVADASPPPGLRIDLEKAVARLPEGARIVFVLHDIEGYRHEEIAQLTGMAEGTARSQLHRARRRLREVLAP